MAMALIRVVAGGGHDKGGKMGHILEGEPIGLADGLICLWN